MQTPIKLMVVDDFPSTRKGLISMLGEYDGQFEVIAEASSVEDAIQLLATVQPHIVLTDFDFGKSKPTGIDLITQIQQISQNTKSILITAFAGDSYLLMAHDAGASAFLHKDAPASELVRAIESAASGFTHFPEALRRALTKRDGEPKLTQREVEILPLIAKGLTAKEIARELNRLEADSITDRTVEVHKGNIRKKFELNSSNALISFAIDFCQSKRIEYR